MKRTAILSLVALIVLAFASVAFADVPAIGAKIDNFTLKDASGAEQTLDGLKGKNGTVIVFVSAQCPVVKGYNDRMNQIAAEYKAKGINFIGINSNATELKTWAQHATDTYKFPVLQDLNNVLADKLGANATPEVYYVGGDNTLIYHGAIDNSRNGDSITEPFLKTAFDASLAGKKVEKATTNAVGCSIKKVNQ